MTIIPFFVFPPRATQRDLQSPKKANKKPYGLQNGKMQGNLYIINESGCREWKDIPQNSEIFIGPYFQPVSCWTCWTFLLPRENAASSTRLVPRSLPPSLYGAREHVEAADFFRNYVSA